MRKLFSTASLFFALAITTVANAQISHGGEPLFNNNSAKVTWNTYYLPTIDNEKYLEEDLNSVKGGSPMRVSVGQQKELDILKYAHLSEDANGKHYLLAVQSPEAKFVTLDFTSYDIPEGATLYIYDQSGEFVLGSFNKDDVKEDGRFYTQAIPGSTAYIEYNVPADKEPGTLIIGNVGHGYKDIFQMISDTYSDAIEAAKGPHGTAEGSCHINVACSAADDWRDQVRSVVAIEIRANTNGGQLSFMCSGALINNTNQDRTPYVLSAFHCQDEEAMLGDLQQRYPNLVLNGLDFVFYFLYQTSTCSATVGSSNKSVTGAQMLAKYSYNGGSDFLLMRISNAIPDTYKPYYAGWDRNNVATATPGACIHHPGGDFKKISIPKTVKRMSGSYNKFWEVAWYTGNSNKGVTEQGSSGSPLFNADKRIIGQLYAGSSACNYMSGTDLYGRIYNSWTGGGTTTNSLSSWLDPANTGVMVLDGIDYTGSSAAINSVEDYNSAEMTVYPNPSNGNVHFDVNALGMANYKVFDLSGRCVKEGYTVLTATSQALDLSSLDNGTYILNLYTSSNSYTSKIIIKK